MILAASTFTSRSCFLLNYEDKSIVISFNSKQEFDIMKKVQKFNKKTKIYI
jgi:hypothetical protein